MKNLKTACVLIHKNPVLVPHSQRWGSMMAIPFEPLKHITVGPLTVQPFGALIAIGIAAAYFAARRLIQQQRLNREAFDSLFLWAVLAGVAGARLLYVTLNLQLYRNPVDILKVWEGGLVSYGGLVGGALAAWLYARYKRLDFGAYADAVAPFVLLGWAFGRLGDFLTGQLVGTPSELPWAVTGDVPRHPVQAYAAIVLFLLFLIVRGLQGYLTQKQLKLPRGSIALMTLGLYGIERFFIEFLRDYPNSEYLFDYRAFSQGVSVSLLMIAIVSLAWKWWTWQRNRTIESKTVN